MFWSPDQSQESSDANFLEDVGGAIHSVLPRHGSHVRPQSWLSKGLEAGRRIGVEGVTLSCSVAINTTL